MSLRHSPLHDEHQALGAKFTEFGGWEMPLSYPDGTIAEHLECRRGAVAFDVSHLGTVRVTGAAAKDLLQASFTNDLDRIGPGRAQYTHLLDEIDGSVLDDIIVWWVDTDRFDVMPNASNTSRVRGAIGGEDVTEDRAIIAIQGPQARVRLAGLLPEPAAVPHFSVQTFTYAGVECVAAGTGYTGEDGLECAVPRSVAPQFWRDVLRTGVRPAGLGARDTLRLEAALPLHSHELGPGITPLQAGLAWVVAFDKGAFRGRAALVNERERGVSRRLRALVADGRRPPHPGDALFIDDVQVGSVTSGNFSPLLARGIALGFLPPNSEVGTRVVIETRGVRSPATVVKPPFTRLSTDDLAGAEGGPEPRKPDA